MSIYRICALVAALVVAAALPARANEPRIVTLIPSLAEDAFALGAHVVGVSRFTDDLPAKGLPVIGDFQSVDIERIVQLHPDAVIGLPSQEKFVAPLRAAGIRVVLVPDDTFDDIFLDIRTIGDITGRRPRAERLVAELRGETARLQRSVRSGPPPSVFFVLGTGPIWTVGDRSYIATLIRLAGGRNAARALPGAWGEYSEEALLRSQPDAIVTGSDTHLRDVLEREPWRSLRAVREGHVFSVSDQRVQNALYRPAVHYNEGLRWLIERLSSLSTSTTHNARSNRS